MSMPCSLLGPPAEALYHRLTVYESTKRVMNTASKINAWHGALMLVIVQLQAISLCLCTHHCTNTSDTRVQAEFFFIYILGRHLALNTTKQCQHAVAKMCMCSDIAARLVKQHRGLLKKWCSISTTVAAAMQWGATWLVLLSWSQQSS